MRPSSLLLVLTLGSLTPLVACSGRAIESHEASSGSGGSDESSGAAGTSPGGALGVAGVVGSTAQAGAAGMTTREPEKHRPTATACDHTRPSAEPDVPADGDPSWVMCQSNAECTDGENGRCTGNGHDGYQCTYDACFSDSDCPALASGTPRLCQCEGGSRADNNVCLGGNCRVDADCGGGGYCSPTLGSCGNYTGTQGYYCHTSNDECLDDADCNADGSSYPGYCAFMPEVGHWMCSMAQCAG
jgi:hypothetical protein